MNEKLKLCQFTGSSPPKLLFYNPSIFIKHVGVGSDKDSKIKNSGQGFGMLVNLLRSSRHLEIRTFNNNVTTILYGLKIVK